MKKQENSPKNSTDLNAKIKELEALSSYFEQQDIDLDQGIAKYEAGMKLVQEMKGMLESYELRIKEIKAKYSNLEEEGEADGDTLQPTF